MTRPIPPHEGDDRPSGAWAPGPQGAPQPPSGSDPGWPPPGTGSQQPGWYGPPSGGQEWTPPGPEPHQPGWYGTSADPWATPPDPWATPPGVPPAGPVGMAPGAPANARRTRRARWPWLVAALVVVLVVSLGTYADVAGVRTRLEHLVQRVDLALHPPADRDTAPTIEVTPPPDEVSDEEIAVVLPDPSDEVELVADPESSTATPTRAPLRPSSQPTGVTDRPTVAPTATAGPTPRPERKPVRFRLKVADPDTRFISQSDNTMCAAAGIQMVLGMHDQVAMTKSVQSRIDSRLEEWESRKDAKAGGWGPSSMAEALAAYGVAGYEVRAYENRNQSLREAAAAMVRTGAPAILIAWRGAHTWVMTGFRADGDPTVFRDARITGISVFDPWYPTVSTIWGPSDPPGTNQDLAEIKRNFLQWERPEGSYPERDGKYIVIVPTIPLRDQRGDER